MTVVTYNSLRDMRLIMSSNNLSGGNSLERWHDKLRLFVYKYFFPHCILSGNAIQIDFFTKYYSPINIARSLRKLIDEINEDETVIVIISN